MVIFPGGSRRRLHRESAFPKKQRHHFVAIANVRQETTTTDPSTAKRCPVLLDETLPTCCMQSVKR